MGNNHVGSIEPDEDISSRTVLNFPFEAVGLDGDGGALGRVSQTIDSRLVMHGDRISRPRDGGG